jgi:hypothetical protein
MKRIQENIDFCIGDSIVVRSGTVDPDLGLQIGGWHGRISDIEVTEQGQAFLLIYWDSITLKKMPWTVIEQCEEKGMDWAEIVLDAAQIEMAPARDTEQDVGRAVAELAEAYAARYLEEQNRQIRKSLAGVTADTVMLALNTWRAALEENRMLFSQA